MGDIQEKQKNNNNKWALFLIFPGLFLLFLALNTDESVQKKKVLPASDVAIEGDPEKVNEHLKMLYNKLYLQKKKVEAENSLLLGEKKDFVSPRQENGIPMKQEDQEEVVKKTIRNRHSVELSSQVNEIYQALEKKNEEKAYDQIYRKEYIKVFLENAQKAGYQIKLDKDLNIIDIKPLKNESKRYPTQDGAAR